MKWELMIKTEIIWFGLTRQRQEIWMEMAQ